VSEDVVKSEVSNHPELLASFRRIVEEGFRKNSGEGKSH
jgi:hypothetical protein